MVLEFANSIRARPLKAYLLATLWHYLNHSLHLQLEDERQDFSNKANSLEGDDALTG